MESKEFVEDMVCGASGRWFSWWWHQDAARAAWRRPVRRPRRQRSCRAVRPRGQAGARCASPNGPTHTFIVYLKYQISPFVGNYFKFLLLN